MKLQRIIEKHWYLKSDLLLTILLLPLSLIYELIITIRRYLFKLKIKPSTRLAVPVVIIGNISVGGAGKTPLTKYLAQTLSAQGIKVGIILRGYKSSTTTAKIVSAQDDSHEVGDEALIYAQAGHRVAIGAKRVAAGKLLLRQFPDTQLILADDGMQHYYLDRDLEICVVDSSRMFGNQQVLPLGPLREPMNRLNRVDALVVNGNYNHASLDQILLPYQKPIYYQELEFIHFFNPVTQTIASVAEMKNTSIMAMAAIGNPGRFFDYLEQLGLKINQWQAFPDHYHYQAADINPKYAIITTEKDYTKLAQFKANNIWIAVVQAKLNNEKLIDSIKDLIK